MTDRPLNWKLNLFVIWLTQIMCVAGFSLIIPFVLTYAYHIPGGIPFFMLTVGAGEVISCLILGQILLTAILPIKNVILKGPDTM